MRLILAILLGTIISKITQALKIGGGTAAPGLYALKIDPQLVNKLVGKIPRNVVITGTNGKTTTARMLSHFAKEAGLKVIRNHTGSNLERGIASTLINLYSHIRSGNVDLGIWELDEAAFNTVAPKIKPEIVVFLNVFRDQLDRYGEVDSVVKRWCNTLKALASRSEPTPKTIVLVNGDDVNTAKLAKCFSGKVQKFGVKDYKIVGESLEHIKERGNLDYEAKNVKLNGLNGSAFSLVINHNSLIINLPIPGIYHIYDALAAIACASLLNLPTHRLTDSLKNYSPAFGRVEKLDFGYVFSKKKGKLLRARSKINHTEVRAGAYIFLIKNPAGATQVFETIAPHIKPQDRLLLALNDNIADGTDVSWIWDAKFEIFQISSRALRRRSGSRDLTIYVSGLRAYDLATRLKYASFDPKKMIIEPDLQNALKRAKRGLKGTLFILPTYTAMLELQKILTQSGIKRYYWEEE